jgi:L-seryl-tRNA(Ser) seleniumtransferase
MLDVSNDMLRDRAERILAQVAGRALVARVGTGHARMGGGTLPRSSVPSVTLDLTHRSLTAQDLAGRLRDQHVPVIGYIVRGSVKLDLRTVFPRQDADLITALRSLQPEVGV